MAHEPNFQMKNYAHIWQSISPLLLQSDFAFANLESTVDDEKNFSGYPRFNMRENFPNAAIDAGFNVFSLANNHSTDNGERGILQTKKWSTSILEKTKTNERNIFFSGIKNENEKLQSSLIEKNGWRILFCAATEIVNETKSLSLLNYISPAKKSREVFLENLKQVRSENPCDIFVLSLHENVPEYEKKIASAQKEFYHELLNAGVDILWANHPHIVLETEIVLKKNDKDFFKIIFYANGNTISAQRTKYNFSNPNANRENTGDGLLSRVTLSKKNKNARVHLENLEPFFITTAILENREFVVRFLDDEFILELENQNKTQEANYFKERKKIINEIKVLKTWQ